MKKNWISGNLTTKKKNLVIVGLLLFYFVAVTVASALPESGQTYKNNTEIKITAPLNTVNFNDNITGTTMNIPDGQALWILIYPIAADKFYPINETHIQNGKWSLQAQIGTERDNGSQFDIIAVLADKNAQNIFENFHYSYGNYIYSPGMDSLPEGAKIYDYVSVTRLPVTTPNATLTGNPVQVQTEQPVPSQTNQTEPTSESVSLYTKETATVGEKTRLYLSLVNNITNPTMHVQVIIFPPSGMSISSSSLLNGSGSGQYTEAYVLSPGESRLIELYILANEVGNFTIKGNVVYYFGDNKTSAVFRDISIPIQVENPTQVGLVNNSSGFLGNINIFEILSSIGSTVISGVLVVFIYEFFIRKKQFPISYNVAIVGFPKSGKTTMITSLFGETFAGRTQVRAIPKGATTIERINENLEKLNKGKALGPTRDQDRFAFRADVIVKGSFRARTYKVEFGDFPGEDSVAYSEKYGSWLHNTEYFKWVVDCDAIIFVIDLGCYLAKDEQGRKDYIAKMKSALRAAWQRFVDENSDGKKNVKNMPVVLVFTKADLFNLYESDIAEGIPIHYDSIYEEEIMKIGFGDKIPPEKEIISRVLEAGKTEVLADFGELIEYFKNESSSFKVLFISCFGLFEGKRLGISDLLEAVLP